MANATITGTASNFGSISGVLAGEAGTVAGTITGVTGSLTGSVGVPGAGVPSGGTTGQVLKKVSNTDYDTTWGTDLASAAWGTITGTLSSQTDLQTALNLKADLASPALTGNPTAPTAATGDNDTTIATTAFVQQELAAGTAVAKNLEVYVRNQTGATLTAGTIVYINGATGNRPTVTKAQANNDANSAQTFGFVKTSIANNGFGYVIVRGELENVNTSALTEGQQLYLSPTTAGTWTTTKPYAPDHLVYVGIVVRAHPTQGVILVAIQNGYELDEIHNVKLTSPTNGQVLKYDSAQGLWVNGTDSSGVAWGGITGTLSAQTDLQTALDAKATAADFLSKAGNLSGLASVSTARTNLGLGASSAVSFGSVSMTSGGTGIGQTDTSLSIAGSNNAPSFGFSNTTYKDDGSGDPVVSSTESFSAGKTGISHEYRPLHDSSNPSVALTGTNYTYSASTAQIQLYSFDNTVSPNVSSTLSVSSTAITFPDTTVQSTAFIPGDFLSKAGNLSGLADVATSRTNLGLGTMATATASDYLAKADNLSGLTNTGTARTNLGLGTMAVETASNYLTTSAASSTYLTQANAASTYQTQAGMSSYLTISSAASTYQTISGMSSYLTTSAASSTYAPLASPALTGTPTAPTASANTNTTQVATTAFVLGQGNSTAATIAMNGTQAAGTSNLYARADHVHPTDTSRAPLASPALTGTPTAPTASAGTNTTQIATTAFVQTAAPDASTTTKGKVELATIDEAQAGNSTTLVPTVEGVTWMMMNEANRPYFNLTGGSSGTGAAINLVPPFRYEFAGPNASVAGFAYGQTNNFSGMTDGSASSVFNFDQKCWISFGLDNISGTWVGDANNEIKVFWGLNTSNNGDDPNGKAIGVWKQGGSSSYWNLMVHDGTTLTKVASTTTMPTGQLQRFTVYSDGAGNVKLYINGTEVASTSAGPTGTRADTRFWASVKQTASATTRILNMIYYPKVYAQP